MINGANKIHKTSDYSQFKQIKGNRKVNKRHLARLKQSIKRKNLMHLNPIIVNENMEVIDGQHRLQACKELEVPVYYIKGSGLRFDDVVFMNTNVKDWSINDYLHSYVEQGYKDYIYLRDFANKWGLSTATAIAILSMDEYVTRAKYKEFKEGKFEVVDKEQSLEFVKRLREVIPYTTENTWKDRDFIKALSKAYHQGVDHDKLIERIEKYPSPLYRRVNVTDYLRMFEDIYSHGLSGKVRLY